MAATAGPDLTLAPDEWAGIRQFLQRRGVPTDRGAAVLTAQVNRTTEYVALVLDLEGDAVLPCYPAEGLSEYEEVAFGDLLVCYRGDLALPTLASDDGAAALEGEGPFCCSSVAPYKPRRVAHDGAFADLVSGRGSHPTLAFEVKRQVDNGPLLSTRLFKLDGGRAREVPESAVGPKIHSYKNYKCTEHKLFFGVDLRRAAAGDKAEYAAHHMRLNPFSRMNRRVLGEFLARAAA